jgi:hypothetical protein
MEDVGTFCDHFVNYTGKFMDIWHILPASVYFSPVLVFFTQKNLAALFQAARFFPPLLKTAVSIALEKLTCTASSVRSAVRRRLRKVRGEIGGRKDTLSDKVFGARVTRDRCCDFKNSFAEKMAHQGSKSNKNQREGNPHPLQ